MGADTAEVKSRLSSRTLKLHAVVPAINLMTYSPVPKMFFVHYFLDYSPKLIKEKKCKREFNIIYFGILVLINFSNCTIRPPGCQKKPQAF